MQKYVSPYSLWSTNLRMRAPAKAMCPFPGLTVSLFKLGVFVSPFSVSTNRQGKEIRSSYTLKSRFIKRFWYGEDPKGPFPKPLFETYPSTLPDNKFIGLSIDNVNRLIAEFKEKIWKNHPDRKVALQLRAKIDGNHFSMGEVLRATYNVKSERNSVSRILRAWLRDRYSNYSEMNVEYIYLRYAILSARESARMPSNVKESLSKAFSSEDIRGLPEIQNILNLPATGNLDAWGERVERKRDNFVLVRSKDVNGEDIYYAVTKIDSQVREIEVWDSRIETIARFIDVAPHQHVDSFTRTFPNGIVFEYKDGQRLVRVDEKNSLFIQPAKPDKKYKFGGASLDLETRRVARFREISGKTSQTHVLEVVSAAWYWRDIPHTYFVCDYRNSKEMLMRMIADIYENGVSDPVYVHNFSGFDSAFFLSMLADMSDVYNTTVKDGKILALDVTISGVTVAFRDSLLILPAKLSSLAKAFGVTEKGSWDPTIQDSCINLESIREELLAYNVQDCVVLYEVLEKFSRLVWDMFSLNLNKLPTLTSLAFKVFRSKFMNKDTQIHITDQKLFNILKPGYFGGAVDVYQLFSRSNQRVYGYDVNSLYPYVMKKGFYPTGAPTHVYNPTESLHEMFGFIHVEVTCPITIKVPILMIKLNGRTIAGTGTWTGWYFSEELKYAEGLGYRIKIKEAITYKPEKLFAGYVDTLYNMRKTFDKKDPRNLICKLLLNSLYGRFGMSPKLTEWKLHPRDIHSIGMASRSSDFIEFENSILVANEKNYNEDLKIALDQEDAINELMGKYNLSYEEFEYKYQQDSELRKEFKGLVTMPDILNISLPIASAVTAYSRIEIHRYKTYVIESGGALILMQACERGSVHLRYTN